LDYFGGIVINGKARRAGSTIEMMFRLNNWRASPAALSPLSPHQRKLLPAVYLGRTAHLSRQITPHRQGMAEGDQRDE
jgi:hypothetical protein